jgi:phage/plasmid-like protein (TIGR03299 family)
MSHDLAMFQGRHAMAYVGDVPWHGLGQRLDPDQPIDTWVKAAGLGWNLERRPVLYESNGRQMVMDDRDVLARSDTGEGLSVVSSGYKIVQPREVLEFFRDLVALRGYKLETAGALAGGRKIWALAQT